MMDAAAAGADAAAVRLQGAPTMEQECGTLRQDGGFGLARVLVFENL